MRYVVAVFLALSPTVAFGQDMPGMPAMPGMPGVTATNTVTDGDTVSQTVSVEGQPFVINGMNQPVSHVCGSNGSNDVVINGMGSTITLTGECGKVLIGGMQLKVSMEIVSEITVGGMGNVVVYKSGPNGAEVAIENPAPGNTVTAKP